MMVPRALMRHQEKGKGLRQHQREGAGGAHRAALALPQRRDPASASPSYEAIAGPPAAPGARLYEAIRALEQVGVLSWVNRPPASSATRYNDVARSRVAGSAFSRLGPG